MLISQDMHSSQTWCKKLCSLLSQSVSDIQVSGSCLSQYWPIIFYSTLGENNSCRQTQTTSGWLVGKFWNSYLRNTNESKTVLKIIRLPDSQIPHEWSMGIKKEKLACLHCHLGRALLLASYHLPSSHTKYISKAHLLPLTPWYFLF